MFFLVHQCCHEVADGLAAEHIVHVIAPVFCCLMFSRIVARWICNGTLTIMWVKNRGQGFVAHKEVHHLILSLHWRKHVSPCKHGKGEGPTPTCASSAMLKGLANLSTLLSPGFMQTPPPHRIDVKEIHNNSNANMWPVSRDGAAMCNAIRTAHPQIPSDAKRSFTSDAKIL